MTLASVQARADHQREQQAAEQAGPALFHAETQELVERRRDGPAGGSGIAQAVLGRDEPGDGRPLRRRAVTSRERGWPHGWIP